MEHLEEPDAGLPPLGDDLPERLTGRVRDGDVGREPRGVVAPDDFVAEHDVLTRGEGGIEPVPVLEDPTTDGEAARRTEVRFGEEVLVRESNAFVVPADDRAFRAVPNHLDAEAKVVDAGRVEEVPDAPERVRRQFHVVVEEENDVAVGGVDSDVPGRPRRLVFRLDVDGKRFDGPGESVEDGRSLAVGRRVDGVDRDRRVRGVDDGIDGAFDPSGVVVHRDHDVDPWNVAVRPPVPEVPEFVIRNSIGFHRPVDTSGRSDKKSLDSLGSPYRRRVLRRPRSTARCQRLCQKTTRDTT